MSTASRVNCGEVVRAYLAAAEASKTISDHVRDHPAMQLRRPSGDEDLEGGSFTSRDEVAHFIKEWMMRYCDKEPPG